MDSNPIAKFNEIAKMSLNNTSFEQTTKLLAHLEALLELVTPANRASNFDLRDRDTLNCFSIVVEILLSPSSNHSAVRKIITICTKLCSVPVLQDYLQHELMLCIPLCNCILREAIADDQILEFLTLLEIVTRNVRFDYVPSSVHRLFQWLTNLRDCSNKRELFIPALGVQANLCRSDESFLLLLDSSPVLKSLFTPLMDQHQNAAGYPLMVIYMHSLLFASTVLKENLLDGVFLHVIFRHVHSAFSSKDNQMKQAAGDLFSDLVSNSTSRSIVSTQYDLEALPLVLTENIDENESNPSALCQVIFDVFSTFPKSVLPVRVEAIFNNAESNFLKLLCDWMTKPIDFNHHIPLSSLKLGAFFVEVAIEAPAGQGDENYLSRLLTIILELFKEDLDLESSYLKFVLQQQLMIVNLINKLVKKDKSLVSNFALNGNLIKTLIVRFAEIKPSLQQLSIQVILANLYLLRNLEDEQIEATFTEYIFESEGFQLFMTIALSCDLEETVSKALDLLRFDAIPESAVSKLAIRLVNTKRKSILEECRKCRSLQASILQLKQGKVSACTDVGIGNSVESLSNLNPSDITSLFQNEISELKTALRDTQSVYERQKLYLHELEANFCTWKIKEEKMFSLQTKMSLQLKQLQQESEVSRNLAHQAEISRVQAASDLDDVKKLAKTYKEQNNSLEEQNKQLLLKVQRVEEEIKMMESDMNNLKELRDVLEKQATTLNNREAERKETIHTLQNKQQQLNQKVKEQQEIIENAAEEYKQLKTKSRENIKCLNKELEITKKTVIDQEANIKEKEKKITTISEEKEKALKLVDAIRNLTVKGE